MCIDIWYVCTQPIPGSPAQPLTRRWPGIGVRFPGRHLHPLGGLPDPSLLTWSDLRKMADLAIFGRSFTNTGKKKNIQKLCRNLIIWECFFGNTQKSSRKLKAKHRNKMPNCWWLWIYLKAIWEPDIKDRSILLGGQNLGVQKCIYPAIAAKSIVINTIILP